MISKADQQQSKDEVATIRLAKIAKQTRASYYPNMIERDPMSILGSQLHPVGSSSGLMFGAMRRVEACKCKLCRKATVTFSEPSAFSAFCPCRQCCSARCLSLPLFVAVATHFTSLGAHYMYLHVL